MLVPMTLRDQEHEWMHPKRVPHQLGRRPRVAVRDRVRWQRFVDRIKADMREVTGLTDEEIARAINP